MTRCEHGGCEIRWGDGHLPMAAALDAEGANPVPDIESALFRYPPPRTCCLRALDVAERDELWLWQRVENQQKNREAVKARGGHFSGLPFGYRRGEFAGRVLVIVGNGPSSAGAADLVRSLEGYRTPAAAALDTADDVLGRRIVRGPEVLTVNGSARAMTDYPGRIWWMQADSLGPAVNQKTLDFMREERLRWADFGRSLSRRPGGCEAMLCSSAPHEVTAAFEGPLHFWLVGHGGAVGARYEELLHRSERARLPRLFHSLTTVTSAMHLGWWLGFHELHLIGVDHCTGPDEAWHQHQPEGAALPGISDRLPTGDMAWQPCERADGSPARTKPYWLRSKGVLEALAMWLRLSGIRIVNHSGGLTFANMEQGS